MSFDLADKILIFTDGACSGNPGPGGYGTIIVFPEGQVKELGGGRRSTTNNKMELMAVIKGLQDIRGREEEVWVLTDSTYVIRGITQWIWGWLKRGWKNAEGKEVANQELWKELHSEVSERKKSIGEIQWKYVRGHQGTPGNERCDEIAVDYTHRRFVELFDGPLLQYPFAIYDVPDDLSLPAMKPKSEKKPAHSYLSYVNGQLKRHKTWAECEATVKGRSGAKFKKSTSAENEREILRAWGLPEDGL